jgi:signal transduction histidine kinase
MAESEATAGTGSGTPPRAAAQSRRLVTTAFVMVGAGVFLATLLALGQTRMLQARTREIVVDMLTSVRLLGQLENAVERRRILVDDHIFETDLGEMARLDREIATIEAEIGDTIRAYDPWAKLPGERDVWSRTQADLTKLEDPIRQALALSRVNRDVEARGMMERVGAEFVRTREDLDELILINDRGANESLVHYSDIRLQLMVTLLGIGAIALVGTIVVGVWASRQVARREEELALHARALEARNRELDAFAGRVAHDIRNPLSSMQLALSTLGRRLPADDRSLGTLNRGAQRMESLVDDLLTLARSATTPGARCDPASVASSVEEDFRGRIEAERGALRVSVAHADVRCSEGLLRQALANLVENAVKYHRPEVAPEVEISGAPANGGYDLRVKDNGVGMSQEEAAHAREPFYRSPRVHGVPGTGLGLSIVNRVAEASGGRLSVESRLGQGSTFVVRLPLADHAALS